MSLDHRVSQGIYISDPDGNLTSSKKVASRRVPSVAHSSLAAGSLPLCETGPG